MKYLTILFLFICEFTMGQIPGMPRLMSKGTSPLVYTISYSPSQAFTMATINAQTINSGNSPIVKSGVLWSTGIPTYDQYSGRTEDGDINGNPFQAIFTSLPTDVAVYFRVYAITLAGEYVYGNALYTPSMTVQSPLTSKIWMARNLGATADPITQPDGSPVDADTASYGYLYQWGRGNDGHQFTRPYRDIQYSNGKIVFPTKPYSLAVAATYATYSNIPTINTNKFIYQASQNWLTNNTTAWNNYERNPCPDGFIVPHIVDFNNEFNVYQPYGYSFGTIELFKSFLRLPVTGYRSGSEGAFSNYFSYNQARYWTKVSASANKATSFESIGGKSYAANEDHFVDEWKHYAFAVRCIKN